MEKQNVIYTCNEILFIPQKGILIYVTIQMGSENMMPSERCEKPMATYCIILLSEMCRIGKFIEQKVDQYFPEAEENGIWRVTENKYGVSF